MLARNLIKAPHHGQAPCLLSRAASTLALNSSLESTSTPSTGTKPKRLLRRPKVDAIKLTEAAVDRVKTLLEGKPEASGVRLGVRTRGCNGLSYTLDYLLEDPKPTEDVVEKDGIRVVIEPKALIHVIGTTMDYKDDAITAEFVFENPNAKGSCGCGESFNV